MKKIGVKRGDVIAFCGENINEFFIGILSTICCGATVTTLNVMYSEDEINHVLNISKPSMIFGSEIAFKRNLGVFKSLPFIKNFVQLNGSPVERGIQTFSSLLLPTDPNMYEPALEARGDDTAFILYSSGTTGLPKGVMLTHLNALYTSEVFEHGELNVVDKSCYTLLTIVPWYHAYGLMSTINNVLLKNTSVYLSGFNPLQYLKCIQDYKVNVLLVVPPIVVFLAKAPIVGKFDLSSVNKIWCGAAPLNSETINETLKRLPNCEGIFQGYGMTETSVAATKDINKDGVVRKPGSGGYVLPGLRAKVVNIETRERLGPYCEGEICFKGPVIMKGYANNKKATAEITDDEGYLNTGDIGYYDDDGCFFVVDRLKELIKYKGHQIDYHTGHKVSYKELLEETVSAAVGLQSMGLNRGDVVGICSENRPEFVTAVMGAICCGAVVTAFNPQYKADEIQHALNISLPKLIVASENSLKKHIDVFKSMPFINKLIQLNGEPVQHDVNSYSSLLVPTNPNTYVPVEVNGTDTVFIFYSSGTTGLPKGVMLSHLNALYVSSSLDFGYTRESCIRFLSILPMCHVFGLFSVIHYLGCNKLLILMVYSPVDYLKAIEEYKVNLLIIVPPIAVFLSKSDLVQKYDLSSVTRIWCGAAPLSQETTVGVLRNFPNCQKIIHGYGMTETSFIIIKSYDTLDSEQKHGSCGHVVPGMKVKVVDINTRQTLGSYERGEVCVKGPLVMKGYMNNDQANVDIRDDEGFLKTGDIGYYDSDGCFYIVDRLKELIKYKGHQVAPAMIERVLLQHSDVLECGVVGAPDELAGELPTAFVVPKPDVTLTEKELLDFTNERLSPITRIRGGIYFVSEIPKSGTGKILRKVLKASVIAKK
ncbi:luciferin 4-monooxygenase isoform X3 [Bombyx mori]